VKKEKEKVGEKWKDDLKFKRSRWLEAPGRKEEYRFGNIPARRLIFQKKQRDAQKGEHFFRAMVPVKFDTTGKEKDRTLHRSRVGEK